VLSHKAEKALLEPACSFVACCVAGYRYEVRRLVDQPLLSRSYERIDVDRLPKQQSIPH
jgi:hypothetical protein